MQIIKGSDGSISVLDISLEEASDIGTILFEAEHSIPQSRISEKEKARLCMLSAKLRFQIIDSLRIENNDKTNSTQVD